MAVSLSSIIHMATIVNVATLGYKLLQWITCGYTTLYILLQWVT